MNLCLKLEVWGQVTPGGTETRGECVYTGRNQDCDGGDDDPSASLSNVLDGLMDFDKLTAL